MLCCLCCGQDVDDICVQSEALLKVGHFVAGDSVQRDSADVTDKLVLFPDTVDVNFRVRVLPLVFHQSDVNMFSCG